MTTDGIGCLLDKLNHFLSPQMLEVVRNLSSDMAALRRLERPLEGDEAERAKLFLRGNLKDLVGLLRDIEASLITGLPSDRWAGVGSGSCESDLEEKPPSLIVFDETKVPKDLGTA
ncbi:MAG: hypothetical protein WC831_03430 [Parcubacteria group bacterium]|jgi:hypothetical protein